MATSSKQYKAIGEDLWKGRTEKIVRLSDVICSLSPLTSLLTLTYMHNRMQSSSL
jgi:hypothetical protein